MKQLFTKTFYFPQQHIVLLKNRGLLIADEEKSRRVYLQYRLFPSKCLLLSVAEVSQGTTSVQAGGNFRAGVEHVSFRPQTKVVAL
mgnify:CR=1 FL=1